MKYFSEIRRSYLEKIHTFEKYSCIYFSLQKIDMSISQKPLSQFKNELLFRNQEANINKIYHLQINGEEFKHPQIFK